MCGALPEVSDFAADNAIVVPYYLFYSKKTLASENIAGIWSHSLLQILSKRLTRCYFRLNRREICGFCSFEYVIARSTR